MLDFLSGIADFLSLAVDFFIKMFTSIFQFVGMIPKWQAMLSTTYAQVPDFLLPFCMIGLTCMMFWLLLQIK